MGADVNGAGWGLLAAAGALGLGDWIAVSPAVRAKRVEYLLKPATTLALVFAAVALDPERDAQRAWFVVGLLLSLAGDVFLMLPRDAFVPGLASFLLAHVAYIVGFALEPRRGVAVAVALAVVAVAAATIGRRILTAARGSPEPVAVPVAVYMTAISVMVVLAAGTAEPFAAAGAGLFFASDSLIAWNRFVRPFAWARPAIMATYHLAQAGLVVSLTR